MVRTNANVKRVERKINLIIEDSDIDVESVACRYARALLKKGEKATAIRIYRDWTGVSVAEAQQAVNRLERGD